MNKILMVSSVALIAGMGQAYGAGAYTNTSERTTDRYILVDKTTGAVVDSTVVPDAVDAHGKPTANYAWRIATFADAQSAAGAYIDPTGKYLFDKTDDALLAPGGCPAGHSCVSVNPSDPIAHARMLPDTDFKYKAYGSIDNNIATGDVRTTSPSGVSYSNSGTGASTSMNSNGFRFDDGKGGSVVIKDPTIVVDDGAGNKTTIHNGDVTATGTVTAGVVMANGRDVGASLSQNDAKNAEQDGRLDSHNTRITNAEAKNTEQDGRLDNHNTRINNVQSQADATDVRLNNFNGGSVAIENWATGVNNSITSIDNTLMDHNAWLNEHDYRINSLESWRGIASSQISDLYKRANKANEGVAMAMALPSLTLEAGKRFGMAANYGTFSGANALGAAMAFRINESWQINGGIAGGLNDGQVGGRVGVMYQH